MKTGYSAPDGIVCVIFSDCSLFAVSGGGWDDSLNGVGSNWGGVDTDDSEYGL